MAIRAELDEANRSTIISTVEVYGLHDPARRRLHDKSTIAITSSRDRMATWKVGLKSSTRHSSKRKATGENTHRRITSTPADHDLILRPL
jgi:hypothetical protein